MNVTAINQHATYVMGQNWTAFPMIKYIYHSVAVGCFAVMDIHGVENHHHFIIAKEIHFLVCVLPKDIETAIEYFDLDQGRPVYQ